MDLADVCLKKSLRKDNQLPNVKNLAVGEISAAAIQRIQL